MSISPPSDADRGLAESVRDMPADQLRKIIAACTAEIRRQVGPGAVRLVAVHWTPERVGG